MPKQVPEEKRKFAPEAHPPMAESANEQLAKLRAELAGNKAFGRQRGRWCRPLREILTEMIDTTGSPTQTIKRFDAFAADARVMLQKLARLKRDGENEAFHVLRDTLSFSQWIIPGEIFPLERTKPITVVMFDPERTFFAYKMIKGGQWKLPTSMDDIRWPVALGDFCLADFSRLFPEWEKDVCLGLTGRGKFLHVFWRQIAREFGFVLPSINEHRDFRVMCGDIVKNGQTFYLNYWLAATAQDVVSEWKFPLCFCYAGRPDQLLRLFSRKDQKRIRTWSFDCPVIVGGASSFGFHSADKHAEWQSREPTFTSKNVSEGLGAAILHGSFVSDYEKEARMVLKSV